MWAHERPGYANLHLSGRFRLLLRTIRCRFVSGSAIRIVGLSLLLFGIPGWFFSDSAERAADALEGFLWGFLIGLWITAAFAIADWAEDPAQAGTANTPPTSLRADSALVLMRTAAGAMFAFSFGFVLGLLPHWDYSSKVPEVLVSGNIPGLRIGVTGGIIGGVLVGRHHAWLAYLIATWRLAHAHHLPHRLMRFLDDAHRLGLLRAVGPVYQFRHAELQDHLAAAFARENDR